MTARTFMIFITVLVASLMAVLLSHCSGHKDSEVRIGGLFDLTGQTAETGIMYALGIRHYIDHVNRRGGIHGRKVRLHEIDTAYQPPRDIQGYEKLRSGNGVHMIFGWGTGGTIALMPRFNKDRMPFTSVSFSKILAGTPGGDYHFMMGPTYSDQMLVILRHIKKNWGIASRRPRVAFVYNDREFGKSPIADGRRFCDALGIELVAEEIVFLTAADARDQMTRIKAREADFVIINQTAQPASVILLDAKRTGLRAQFYGLVWCSDDKVIRLSGPAAEGYIGVMTYNFSDPSLPGIAEIIEYRRSTRQTGDTLSLRYVNGWLTARVMLEGVRRAGNDLSGPGIRKGLESIKDFDTGGITPKISFTHDDHVAFKDMSLAQVINGKWRTIQRPGARVKPGR